MGVTVYFDSSLINCGVVAPGGSTVQSTQCGTVSAPVNVTASITEDASGGAFTVSAVTSFTVETKIAFPDPGELLPGTKPIGVREEVAVQEGQSNGVIPLLVESGQF